jgi:hypothetical protein
MCCLLRIRVLYMHVYAYVCVLGEIQSSPESREKDGKAEVAEVAEVAERWQRSRGRLTCVANLCALLLLVHLCFARSECVCGAWVCGSMCMGACAFPRACVVL